MKTMEIPNIAEWERQEYLSSKEALAIYQKKPFVPFIFCDNCRKEIKDLMIHVVNFGKAVACRACFTKKYKNIKRRIGKFPVPEDLAHLFPNGSTSDEMIRQIDNDIQQTNDLQNAECNQIKEKPASP